MSQEHRVITQIPFISTGWPRPTNPDRTEPNPASDFLYEIKGNSVTITGYVGRDGDVVIPEKIDGKRVTCIGKEAFICTSRLTTIKLPSGITSIEEGAFYYCFFLERITIPNSVKELENNILIILT